MRIKERLALDDSKLVNMKLLQLNRIVAFARFLSYPLFKWQSQVLYEAIVKYDVYYISAMRQLGKTHLALFYILILCLAGAKGLYSAHDGKTVDDVAANFARFGKVLYAMRLIEKPWRENQKIFKFKSGGRVVFRPRKSGAGVGTTLDFCVWDEAQKVKAVNIEEIIPAMQNSKFQKQLFIGTPPSVYDWNFYGNTPFVDARAAGKDNFKEFSYAKKYSSDIKVNTLSLRKSNPSWRLIDKPGAYIDNAMNEAKMNHMDACRQILGVWWYPPQFDVVRPELESKVVTNALTPHEFSEPYFVVSVGVDEKSSEGYIVVTNGHVASLARTIPTQFGSVDGIVEWLKDKPRRCSIRGIRVPANAKGRAIAAAIKAEFPSDMIVIVGEGLAAQFQKFFLNNIKTDRLKIVERTNAILALSSFRLLYNPRNGFSEVIAEDPNMATLAKAFINSMVVSTELRNLEKYQQFGSLTKG